MGLHDGVLETSIGWPDSGTCFFWSMRWRARKPYLLCRAMRNQSWPLTRIVCMNGELWVWTLEDRRGRNIIDDAFKCSQSTFHYKNFTPSVKIEISEQSSHVGMRFDSNWNKIRPIVNVDVEINFEGLEILKRCITFYGFQIIGHLTYFFARISNKVLKFLEKPNV